MYNAVKKNDLSIVTLLLSANMIFLILNGSKYFNLGNYFILPVVTISFCILTIIKRKKMSFHFEKKVILFFIFYIFVITAVFGAQFDMLAATLMFYLFILFTSSVPINEREIRFIINSYVFSGLIFAIVLLIQMKQPYDGMGISRLAIFFSGSDYYDVNFSAAYMVIPALICFNRAIEGKNFFIRNLNLVFSGVLFSAIALNGSRGAILPFIAIVCFRLIQLRKIRIAHIFFILIGIILILLYLPEDIYMRVFGKSYIETNQNRLNDWEHGLTVFSMQPWFGHGLYSTASVISTQLGIMIPAHNSIIALLIQYGIIGILPSLIILIYPLFKLVKYRNSQMLLLFYLTFIFTIFMIEANVTMIMLVPLSIIYIIINNCRHSTNNDIGRFIS